MFELLPSTRSDSYVLFRLSRELLFGGLIVTGPALTFVIVGGSLDWFCDVRMSFKRLFRFCYHVYSLLNFRRDNDTHEGGFLEKGVHTYVPFHCIGLSALCFPAGRLDRIISRFLALSMTAARFGLAALKYGGCG